MLLLALLLAGVQVSAQDNSAPPTDGPVIPADEFDRGTPRRSADGFLAAVDEADYETAAEYLDLRNLRGEARELTGVQLARRFSVIIKRTTWVDVDELLDDPAGRGNDSLPNYRDSIGVVLDNGKELRLLMQKVPAEVLERLEAAIDREYRRLLQCRLLGQDARPAGMLRISKNCSGTIASLHFDSVSYGLLVG